MTKHNRKFKDGGINLNVGKRVLHSVDINSQNYIEDIMLRSNFLEGAPFTWVGMTYHYTNKTNLVPEFRRISKKYGDIHIANELDIDILCWADIRNIKLFMEMYMIAAIDGMICLGEKYKLNNKLFIEERKNFREKIPESIEQCEKLPKLTPEDYPPIMRYFRFDLNICSNCYNAKATIKARQCLACNKFNDPMIIAKE